MDQDAIDILIEMGIPKENIIEKIISKDFKATNRKRIKLLRYLYSKEN